MGKGKRLREQREAERQAFVGVWARNDRTTDDNPPSDHMLTPLVVAWLVVHRLSDMGSNLANDPMMVSHIVILMRAFSAQGGAICCFERPYVGPRAQGLYYPSVMDAVEAGTLHGMDDPFAGDDPYVRATLDGLFDRAWKSGYYRDEVSSFVSTGEHQINDSDFIGFFAPVLTHAI